MLERMSSRQLAEWMAFYRLEPFGIAADAMIGGGISSVFAEVHRDKKKRSAPYQPGELAIQFDQRAYMDEVAEKEQEKQEAMSQAVMSWALSMGVDVVDLREEA